MRPVRGGTVGVAAAVLGVGGFVVAAARAPEAAPRLKCDGTAGLTLPAGFCATVFADRIGAPRHMVVAPNGDLLVIGNPQQTGAEAGGGSRIPGALMLLRDANHDGKADTVIHLAAGSGSGIALANGYLYTSSGRSIVRYTYTPGMTSVGAPDTVISDLAPMGHTAYNFVIVGTTLYMNVGSRTNACQPVEQDRRTPSPGVDPCTELESRAGVWAFDANRTGQKPTDGRRYATGIRNAVSLTVNPADQSLWATMHGRDQLGGGPEARALWTFSAEYNAENPAEETLHIRAGDDFGWPYCYYSNEEHKLVTAPEYGGDGKQSSRCGDKKAPVWAFPGHWAPNDMLFYTGAPFPAEYRQGAFIAFHGSWNRAPLPAQGFKVVFLPIGGETGGPPRDFATGFSAAGGPGADGRIHRPTGLAQGPDGALYVSDDVGGTIYKITYER